MFIQVLAGVALQLPCMLRLSYRILMFINQMMAKNGVHPKHTPQRSTARLTSGGQHAKHQHRVVVAHVHAPCTAPAYCRTRQIVASKNRSAVKYVPFTAVGTTPLLASPPLLQIGAWLSLAELKMGVSWPTALGS